MEYGLLCKPMVIHGIVVPDVCRVAAFQCKENRCKVELADAPPIKSSPVCKENQSNE